MFNAVEESEGLRKPGSQKPGSQEVRRQKAEVGSQESGVGSQDDKESRRSQSCKPWRAGIFSPELLQLLPSAFCLLPSDF